MSRSPTANAASIWCASSPSIWLKQLIEVEASQKIGAGRYERSDERVTERNGHRHRVLTTKAGDLELAIPKLRKGSFFPSILEPRRSPCSPKSDGTEIRYRTRVFINVRWLPQKMGQLPRRHTPCANCRSYSAVSNRPSETAINPSSSRIHCSHPLNLTA